MLTQRKLGWMDDIRPHLMVRAPRTRRWRRSQPRAGQQDMLAWGGAALHVYRAAAEAA